MEKSAQPGWGGGGGVQAHPLSLHSIYRITYKVVAYAPSERADTPLPISYLPIYVLCDYEIEKVDKKPSLVLES
jgi:hypothetical protein